MILQTLVGYAVFAITLFLIVYIWYRDFVNDFVILIFVFPVIFTLLAIPIGLVLIGWLYIQQKRWGSGPVMAASMWICQEKAYLPVLAEPSPGLFVDISPVYISDLEKKDLIATLEKVLAAGHPQEPVEAEDYGRDPLLATAKIPNRSEFDTGFIIRWTSKLVLLDIVEAKRKLNKGTKKQQRFPGNASLDEIVEAILLRLRD